MVWFKQKGSEPEAALRTGHEYERDLSGIRVIVVKMS
jgi:hypothetical protein